MKSVHSQTSNRLNWRQLVSLKLVFRCTVLKGYQCSWSPYLDYAFRTLNAEGLQACKRLKFYKEAFEEMISDEGLTCEDVLHRKGYRPLKPLVRAYNAHMTYASEHCRDRYEEEMANFTKWMLTVLRVYELYTCTDKELDLSLRQFKADFLIPVGLEDYENNYFQTAQLWFQEELRVLRQNNFPVDKFQKYLSREGNFLRDLGHKYAKSPELSATFLSKSSPHKISLGKQRRSLPSLCMADYDNALYLRTDSFLKELVEGIGNDYIQDVYCRDTSIRFSMDDPVKDGLDDHYVLQYLRDHGIGDNVYATVALANDGGKARIITKAPYAIQYALSPLSDTLFGILRSISTDYTKSHDAGFAYMVRKLSDPQYRSDHIAFCEDQTAATDNFPAVVQAMVLEKLFGPRIAFKWYMIMRLPTCMQYSGGDLHDQNLYRFSKGQPMGVKTSWPAFAITYHVITAFVADMISTEDVTLSDLWYGKPSQRGDLDYIQVGDDRVYFWNKRDLNIHISIEKALGLVVNETKSKTFDMRHSVDRWSSTAEFVKRLYSGDFSQECSGLKPKSLSKIYDYGQLKSAVALISKRDMQFSLDTLFIGISRLKDYHKEYAKYSLKELDRMIRIPMCMGGLAQEATSCSALLLVNASYETIRSTIKRIYGWKYRSFVTESDKSDIDDVAKAFPGSDHKILNPMKTVVQRYLASRDNDKVRYLTEVRPLVQRIIDGYADMLSCMQPASLDDYYINLVSKNDFVDMFEETVQAISRISDVPFWMAQKKDRFIANDVIHHLRHRKLRDADSLLLLLDKDLETDLGLRSAMKTTKYYDNLLEEIMVPLAEDKTPEPSPFITTSSSLEDPITRDPEDMTDVELVEERGRLLKLLSNPSLPTTERLSVQRRIADIGDALTRLL